jgi:hypothetical protein
MRIKFTDGTQPPTQQLRRTAPNPLFSLFSKFLPIGQFYRPPLFAFLAPRADEVSHEILELSRHECGATARNDPVRYRLNVSFSPPAEYGGYDPQAGTIRLRVANPSVSCVRMKKTQSLKDS